MPIEIEALPIGLVAVAVRTWRHRGRRLLTAIVKVTFDLHHDSVMTPTLPKSIVTEERHFRGSPVASLVRGSDLALLVPQPEVVIVGSAYASAGQRTPSTTARFAVQRDSTMLISKRVDVAGDRRALPGAPAPDPLPFDRMPIQYERALGGIASRENPVGIGMAPENDGLVSYPNITLPAAGGVAPAGFGPIPSAWPVRQKRRGSMPWAAANTHRDVDVPDDFDDAYFQTAPSDQRTRELLGGDLIAIVNMHPEIGTMRCYVPTSRGVALLQTASGERVPFGLRIDTIHLEPDAMRAEIVYRGAMPLEARHTGQLWLAGALEPAEERLEFPDLCLLEGKEKRSFGLSPRAQSGADFSGTMLLEPEPLEPPARRGADRGGGTQVLELETPIEKKPQPLPAPPPPGAAPTHGHSGTMIIEPEPAQRERVPDRSGEQPAPVAPPPNKHSGTMIIEAELPPQSLPFARRKRRPSGERAAVRADAAGTPWAANQPAPIQPAGNPLEATMHDEVTLSGDASPPAAQPPPPPPPPPPAPPVATEPAQPAAEPAQPKSPWREDPPVSVPKEAPKAAPVQRANFKASVYKKFKR